MNRKNKLICSTILLTLLAGCKLDVSSSNNINSTSSSISSSTNSVSISSSISSSVVSTISSSSKVESTSTSTSSSSIIKEKSLEDMLLDLKTDNITYQSDYFIYYYDLDEEEIIPLKEYDVTAKVTEEVYDMVAYENGMIASYAHLEKDKEGYVTYSDINIKNELVVNRAVDGNGDNFLWEESVYYNLINYLEASDFTKVNKGLYEYTNDDLSLPLSIVHTAIPVSTFDIDSFLINVENDRITSFFYQEKESDDVYENAMYGRRLEIYFEDIDCTEITRVKPYEDRKENESLANALNELRTSSNYSIETKAFYEDGQIRNLYETYVTETDIIQTQHSDNNDYIMGCHTVDNSLYIFENVKGYLLGAKANTGVIVNDFLPTFDFSEDVFELVEESEGYKVYRPFDQMVNVLNYVDVLLEHSEEYYAPSGDILFYVKDDHLEKIEFPVFTYTQEDAIIAIQQINYSNIGTTVIDSSTWDNFVLEIPKGDVANTWYDDTYTTKINKTTKTMTLGEIFDTCTNEENYIPYFIEDWMNISFDAEYSKKDSCVYVEISFKVTDSTFRERVKTLFLDNGYKTTISDDIFEEFAKGDVIVNFLFDGSSCVVMIDLPIGNILN